MKVFWHESKRPCRRCATARLLLRHSPEWGSSPLAPVVALTVFRLSRLALLQPLEGFGEFTDPTRFGIFQRSKRLPVRIRPDAAASASATSFSGPRAPDHVLGPRISLPRRSPPELERRLGFENPALASVSGKRDEVLWIPFENLPDMSLAGPFASEQIVDHRPFDLYTLV